MKNNPYERFKCWLINLAVTNTLSSNTKFIITQGDQVLSITWANILKNLDIVTSPPVVIEEKEVYIGDGTENPYPYDMVGDEAVVWCSGTGQVNLIPIADCNITTAFNANGGTITFNPQSGDTIPVPINVLTDGSTARLRGNKSNNEWTAL